MSRFRLYPSPAREEVLVGHCAHARFVWNLALEQRLMWRRDKGPTPSSHAQAAQLTEARAAEPWLAAGSVTVQQQALRDHEQSWQYFFAGTHGKPNWRKRGIHEGFRIVGKQATRVRQDNGRWSSIRIPKVGWVPFRRSRAVPDAKSYRVTRDRTGRWHIAFAAIPEPISAPGGGETIGVDRGSVVAAAFSTGEMSSPAGLRPKEAARLQRLQRQLARATHGSNRRRRIRTAIARLRARDAHRRKDWVEKTSTRLASEYDLIRIEDLNVQGMTRSARGTMNSPGRNVRQKAALNRGILAAGWTMLATRLEQKAPGRVEKVNPAYTSQTCSACKYRASENRKSQAVFRCIRCGYEANADVNAACNIAAGHAVTARGGRANSARTAKREPQRNRLLAGSV